MALKNADAAAKKRLDEMARNAAGANTSGGKKAAVDAKFGGGDTNERSAYNRLYQLAQRSVQEQAQLKAQSESAQQRKQPTASMRQGTKQASTAESRLSQRRFDATSFQSTKLRDEAVKAEQRANDDTLDRKIELTQERLQTTLPKKETPAGLIDNPEYQALYDALSGYQRQKTAAEQEAKDAADAYNTASGLDAKKIAGLRVAPYFREGTNISDAAGLLDEYLTYQDAMQNGVAGAGDGWKTARAALIGAGLSEDSIDEVADIWRRASNSEAAALSNQSWAEATREHPILASAISVPLNITSGLGYLDLATQKMGSPDKTIDFNTGTMRAAGAGSTIRETATENMNGLESFLYQTGMSMADSTAVAALSQLGVPGASVLLSGSAATSAAKEAKERGGTDAQALGYGLAAGIAEGLFETVSLEMLTKNAIGRLGRQAAEQSGAQRILTLLKSAGIQAATEGSEEVFTTIANTISDAVVMGDKSEYAQNKQQYMDAGMSEDEAKKKAAEDWLTGILGDFLGGALSGGIMGGAASALSANTEYTFDDETPELNPDVQQETPQDILERVALESVQEQQQASPENTQRVMEQMSETPQQAMDRLAAEAVAPRTEPAYNGTNNNETEVGSNGREDLYLRGSGERNDRQNPGGQVSAVEEDAGRDQSRDVQTRSADGGAASLTYGEKISTRALGIANGSTTTTLRRVASGETDSTRGAKAFAEQYGAKLVLFGGGNLRVKGSNGAYIEARGMISGDTIYCRADHARFTSEQLVLHEIGHKWVKDGDVNVDAVRAKLNDVYSSEELDRLSGMYIDAYGSTGLTVDEVWEEVMCDAVGYMNEFQGFKQEAEAEEFLFQTRRAAWGVREETQAAKDKQADNQTAANDTGPKYSIDEIVDKNGESYGRGVHLDSTLLDNLTDSERVQMVKERVKELGGQHFTAYDSNGNEVDVKIAEPQAQFVNKSGKNVPVNRDLTTKNRKSKIKQEAVILADELITTAKHDGDTPARYPHGWLDNYGKNDWAKWTTFIQDKENTVWEATLHIATSADGEKILYDIDPINKAKAGPRGNSRISLLSTGQPVKSGTSTVEDSISEDRSSVKQKFSRELDSDGRELTEAQREYFAESKVRDENGQLKVMYRGGNGDFTVFDRKKSSYSNLYGRGFYFTDSEAHAKQYGNARAFYLNITTPVSTTETTITRDQMRKFLKSVAANEDDFSFENYGYDATVSSVLKSVYGKSDFSMLYDVNQTAIGDMVAAVELFNKVNGTNYDGLILDTETVAFQSNQIKSVTNQSPTSDPDVRFSRELSIDRLNEENDLLQQTIEGFRESGETSNTVSEQDAEKVAKKIIKEYSGTIAADDISGDVRELSGMIARGDWDAAKAKATEISQGVINSALAESEGYAENAELYKEIKKTLRNENILISREASRDIPDYNQWRKQYFGRLNVKIADGDTGVSGVDAVYERLSGKYPGIFKPGALAESDALLSIADALDKMRPELSNPHSYYMTEATEYCANELINLLAGDRMKQAAPQAAERIETLTSEGRTRTQEALDKLREAYGTIKPGENPSREVALPKKTSERKYLSQTVRTILESNVTPDAALPTIEQAVLDGDFSYTRYADKAAIEDAKGTIQNKGWATALTDWSKAADKGIISKKNTAIGWALYNNAVNDGDMNTAMDILGKIVTQQHNAAQAVQATRLLKKMSPEAQLYQVSRSVANIQEELKRRYKDKAPKLKINEEYAEEFLNAKTDEERDAAGEKLFRDIGQQVPTTFRDRWNAWRYLAMLLNPRTHIRNIAGNFGFAIPVAIKNVTATGIEKAVSVVSGGKIERSKSPVLTSKAGRALLQEGWADYKNVADEISAGRKYSDSAMQNQQVEAGRRIFGNTRFQTWNKTGGRLLEAARKGNSNALEIEDVWFSKPHYAFAFAQYCKASGVTAEQVRNGTADEVKLFKARTYAIKEAQKATYHDTNAFSEWVSGLGRYDGENSYGRAASVLLEGILPFRKTPANILARGVEYSPLGFLNGLKKAMFDVRKGNSTAAEAIDSISAGLTGTGLLGLGIYLAAQGVVRGLGAGDDDEREFADLQGQQDYSMIIGDQSYTLDWLAPEALPFFIGVNLYEEMQTTGDGVTPSAILNAVKNVSEPLLSMTCLQSLNDIFSSIGYASQEGLSGMTNAIASAATSYLTQAIPTILGQAERTAQADRMTTYTEKNSFLTGDMQYALGKASSRTPGWDYNQIPYIDAWGRRETTNSVFVRGMNNFLNPAYASTIESSDMEKELERLYGETSASAVFPSRAAKYFNVDGKRVDLTGEQYVTYATEKGQTSYKLVTELVGTDYYKKADDADKAEMVSMVYEYANAIAKTKVSDYKLDGWVAKAADAEKYGVSLAQYIQFRTTADADGNGSVTQEEAAAAVRKLGLKSKAAKAKLWQSCNAQWKPESNPF